MYLCKLLSGTTTTNNRGRHSKTTSTTQNHTTHPLTSVVIWCQNTKKSCLSTTLWLWRKNSTQTSITLRSLPRTPTRQVGVSSAVWCSGVPKATSILAMKETNRLICGRHGTETWAHSTSKRIHAPAAMCWLRRRHRELKVRREWCSNNHNQLIIRLKSRRGSRCPDSTYRRHSSCKSRRIMGCTWNTVNIHRHAGLTRGRCAIAVRIKKTICSH